MTYLVDKNKLLQKQGLFVLRSLKESRWVSDEDKEIAQSAIADYAEQLKDRLRNGKAKGAK